MVDFPLNGGRISPPNVEGFPSLSWKEIGDGGRISPDYVEEIPPLSWKNFPPPGWLGTRCIVGKYAAQAKFCIQLSINLFPEVNKLIQPNVNGGRIYPHSGPLRIAMVEVIPPSRRLSRPSSDVQADHRTWFITIYLARRRDPRPWLFAPSWKKFPPTVRGEATHGGRNSPRISLKAS
jgi:hypothetical protein